MLYNVLYFIFLHYTALDTLLYFDVLHYTAINTVLYFNVLHCTALHCTAQSLAGQITPPQLSDCEDNNSNGGRGGERVMDTGNS